MATKMNKEQTRQEPPYYNFKFPKEHVQVVTEKTCRRKGIQWVLFVIRKIQVQTTIMVCISHQDNSNFS